MTSDYYDRDGKPIDAVTFGRLFSDFDYKVVAAENVELEDCEARVSTVWLGMNHNFGGGRPLLFETMIFDGGNKYDNLCTRYYTEQEALDGHEAIVLALGAGTLDQTIEELGL